MINGVIDAMAFISCIAVGWFLGMSAYHWWKGKE